MAINQERPRSLEREATLIEKEPRPLKPVQRTEVWPAAIRRDGTARFEAPATDGGIRELPQSYNIERDRVRWGPVWAGMVTALTALFLFSLLGLAISLSKVDTGTMVATGKAPVDTGLHAAIWLLASGFIAFLAGGYVTGRAAAVFARGWGALNGVLVFFLAVPLVVWLAGLGILANLGWLGGILHDNLSLVQRDAYGVAPAGTAWVVLGGLLLALLASALGGYLGTRRPQVNRATGSIRE